VPLLFSGARSSWRRSCLAPPACPFRACPRSQRRCSLAAVRRSQVDSHHAACTMTSQDTAGRPAYQHVRMDRPALQDFVAQLPCLRGCLLPRCVVRLLHVIDLLHAVRCVRQPAMQSPSARSRCRREERQNAIAVSTDACEYNRKCARQLRRYQSRMVSDMRHPPVVTRWSTISYRCAKYSSVNPSPFSSSSQA
jgi:hypothetical protein